MKLGAHSQPRGSDDSLLRSLIGAFGVRRTECCLPLSNSLFFGKGLERLPLEGVGPVHRPGLHGGQPCCAWYPKQALCLQRFFHYHLLAQKERHPAQMVLAHRNCPSRPTHGSRSRASNQREIKASRRPSPFGIVAREIGVSVQAGIWNFDGKPSTSK